MFGGGGDSGSFGESRVGFARALEAPLESEHCGEGFFCQAGRRRRQKKREFRRLWIQRINAGARLHDLTYSKMMYGLSLANIEINRKNLAELAYSDPSAFGKYAESAKAKLS